MELLADSVVTLIGLVVLGATVWAVRDHFTSEKMSPRAQAISAAVILNAVWLIVLTFTQDQPLAAQLVGGLVIIGSAQLFFAAIKASKQAQLRYAFDPEKPQSLLKSGPYGLVRHPFYVSYVLLWLGWALATWSVWSLPLFLVLLVLYIMAAKLEEHNFASTEMAGEHDAYKREVGFFCPKISTLWPKST